MTDLKKIMEKLNSQMSDDKEEAVSKPKPKKLPTVPIPAPVDDFDDSDDDDEEEKDDDKEEVKAEKEEAPTIEVAEIAQNIEKLQNTGFFRYELLVTLHKVVNNLEILNFQLNKALGANDGKE